MLVAITAILALGGLQATPHRDKIVGGDETKPGEFDPVVGVEAGHDLCTGTLVTPEVVLTAGHCLADIEDEDEIRVLFGQDLSELPQTAIHATDFGVHPDFCADCGLDIHDYGYIVIGAEYTDPDGVIPPIVDQSEWDDMMRIGEEVTLVGYGVNPDAESITMGIGQKRKVETQISKWSPAGLEFFAGGDNRDSCQGDSGGPAFVTNEDGELRLAGITSRGSDPCGNGGLYGVPYPALAWLADEADVNLCGEDCPDCSCLDVSPPDEGCNVAPAPARPSRGALWLGVLLLAGAHVRRARRAAQPPTNP